MSTYKNVSERGKEVSAEITPEVIADYLSGKPEDIPDTMTVAEAIERLYDWSRDAIKDKAHTEEMDVHADIELDVEIEYDDVTDFLDDASDKTCIKVYEYLAEYGDDDDNDNDDTTLYDEMKMKICEKAMEKYTVDQLERRLGMDWT